MFNLLPPNVKKIVIWDYRKHLLIVVLLFVLISQVVFSILLFPSWILSLYKEKAAIAQSQQIKLVNSSKGTDSIVGNIKATNTQLNLLQTTLGYPKLFPLIDTLISKKPQGIRLVAFSYSSATSTKATLSLSGNADSREILVSFAKNLTASGAFKNVDLPISNLAPDNDIDFSITLAIEQ